MKRHIRIKVKTLLMLTLTAVLLVLGGNVIFKKSEYSDASSRLTSLTLKIENQRLTQIFDENDYQIYMLVAIEDGYMLNGNRISTIDASNIYSTYLEYSKRFDLYNEHADYVINVALSQWFSGGATLALEVLDGFSEQNRLDEGQLIKAGMLVALTEYELAIETLKEIQGIGAAELKGQLLSFIDKVIGVSIGEIEPVTTNSKKGKYDQLFNSFVSINKNFKKQEAAKAAAKLSAEDGFDTRTISGRVLINQEPVHGALLYQKTHSGMSSGVFSDTAQYVTDRNGYYQIEDVTDDVSGIGIVISWHLVHDKQKLAEHYAYTTPLKDNTVNFEFYDGVRLGRIDITNDELHYEIEDPSGKSDRAYHIIAKHSNPNYDINAQAHSEQIKNHLSGVISLDMMRLNSRFAFEFSSSMDELKGDRFFEPLYFTDDYIFSVGTHYPNNSNLYVINGFYSDALSTRLFVKGQENLSAGDELLFKGKIEDAIQWYDENRSLHALKVLKALYTKGYLVEKTTEFWQVLGGADAGKAAQYTKALIDEYGQTTELILDLARHLEHNGNFEEATEQYEKLIEMSPENSFYHDKFAWMQIVRGSYMDGVQYFDAHVKEDVRRYWWNNIFVLGNMTEYMSREFAGKVSLIEGVTQFSEFHERIRAGHYDEAMDWLKNQPESDLKTMYELIWKDVFRDNEYVSDYDDFYEYYRETTFAIDDSNVAEVLKAIKLYHNWFN
jgi:tetratricopeptide (TPR) repeat protein